jgi:hypothetical protein
MRLQQGFADGETGFGVKLHSSNSEPLMSALCQKQTFCAAAETGAIRSSGRLFIPPALRERDVRLGEFVSYGEDTMFHCGAIAL